ncbi:MAG: hypothetical protein K4H23_03950, partial [Mollicutes bacterium PWAP]|nr:hypothetical protein [Mollicutes bacterium PWAP]
NNTPFIDFKDFIFKMVKNKISEKKILLLIESSVLRNFGNQESLKLNLQRFLDYFNGIKIEKKDSVIYDFDLMPSPKFYDESKILTNEIKNEINYLGLRFNSFETSNYEKEKKLFNLITDYFTKVAFYVSNVVEYDKRKVISVVDSTTGFDITIWSDNFGFFTKQSIGKIYEGNLKLDFYRSKIQIKYSGKFRRLDE